MDAVIRCATIGCGTDIPKGQAFCPGCGSPTPSEKPAPPAHDLHPPGSPLIPQGGNPVPDSAQGLRCPECGFQNERESDRCLRCGVELERLAGWLIEFPWGRVPIRGPLLVGRGDASPLAEALANIPTVSRRHAELRDQGEVLIVADLGSSNGTFVNGRQLTSDEVSALVDGDRVGFGRRLQAVIRRGGGDG